MKIIFQELCTQKVNWDQELHGDTLLKWNSFLTQLESLNNVRISQYHFQANIKPSSIQLRGFSDPSKQAYPAVVYLRSSHDDGHVKVSVVSSKPQSCPSEATINPSPRIAGDMHFGATDGHRSTLYASRNPEILLDQLKNGALLDNEWKTMETVFKSSGPWNPNLDSQRRVELP